MGDTLIDPEKRAILYIKDSLERLTEATKGKFENTERRILSIETLLNQLEGSIPKALGETIEKLNMEVSDLRKDVTDLQNTRKREVAIYGERLDKIEEQLKHQKEAIRNIMAILQNIEPEKIEDMVDAKGGK